MTSCRHLVVVGAANMERGTFTIKKWPSNFFFRMWFATIVRLRMMLG
jgi:hypothetical protein